MKKIYEVSRYINDGMMVYPGDKPVRIKRSKTIERDGYNWSEICSGTHIGTHIDAPLHFIKGGMSMDEFGPGLMISRAYIVDIKENMITAEVLKKVKIKDWSVVLFKTRNQKLWQKRGFSPNFVSITPDGADFLVKKGTKLVGIDYMSIETHYTHSYPVHNILLKSGCYIIEGLILNKVPAGRYNCYCFPMQLKDADGSPTRILLANP